MKLPSFVNQSLKTVKSNSPEILTGLGVAGVPITSYLVGRASFKAVHKFEDKAPDMAIKERVKLVWKFYIPSAVSGSVTIACIIGASKASGKRTAAAVTAYSITQKAFDQYKEHVIEEIGKGKEQKIRDTIAQEKVTENPPDTKEILVIGRGNVLCCELYTGRYFKSDMETLRRAENDLNAMIVNTYYVSMNDWYDLIDLPHTSKSGDLGWDTDKLLELQFTSVISPDGEPCLAFDYNYVRPNHRQIL